MSDVRSFPKLKRILFVFTAFVSLICLNFSLFAVNSSANVVYDVEDTYVIGFPVDAAFVMNYDDNLGNTGTWDVFVPDINVYYYNSSDMPDWFGYNQVSSGNSFQTFRIDYSPTTAGFPDLSYYGYNPTRLSSLKSDHSLIFSSYDDLTDVNFYVTVPTSGSFTVSYIYTIAETVLQGDGTVNIVRRTINESFSYSGTSRVPFFDSRVFDADFFNTSADFIDNEGSRCAWILSTDVRFSGNVFIGNTTGNTAAYVFDDFHSQPTSYGAFVYDISNRLISLVEDPEVVVDFDDISWTDWLVNSVSAFMDFEIVPNFRLSGLLSLLIGMSLFMVFLKVFAGG